MIRLYTLAPDLVVISLIQGFGDDNEVPDLLVQQIDLLGKCHLGGQLPLGLLLIDHVILEEEEDEEEDEEKEDEEEEEEEEEEKEASQSNLEEDAPADVEHDPLGLGVLLHGRPQVVLAEAEEVGVALAADIRAPAVTHLAGEDRGLV